MDKLTIDRSSWCAIQLHQTIKGKSYGCAIGQYLIALGMPKRKFKAIDIEIYKNIPEEGNWLTVDNNRVSQKAFQIMCDSDHKDEDGVINGFKEHANINVTFIGKYSRKIPGENQWIS